jgi:hypothetical protein
MDDKVRPPNWLVAFGNQLCCCLGLLRLCAENESARQLIDRLSRGANLLPEKTSAAKVLEKAVEEVPVYEDIGRHIHPARCVIL